MKKIWIGIFAAFILIAGAFFLLDIRLMNSQTHWETAVATSRQDIYQSMPKITPPATGLYVEGQNPLADALRQRIPASLRSLSYVGEMTMINLPADRMDLPVLYVEIIPVRHSYSPVYGAAEYQVVLAYATNGDISFRKGAVAQFSSRPEQPALQFLARLTLTDVSMGVVSPQGYQGYLVDQIMRKIQETLQKQLAA